ncbi:hypothetical protein L2E82_37097 [Cichorium intybus]|uniref:Uncharacterized protein n=1 Tax=Cichorium intybus TaxID=13427 RepID=A0ACB9ADN8_CICIN|nr:hypothetical protein L2E82_37097 [Cichorium intybus]
MFRVQQTAGSVLCCTCGIPMAPNAANMCATCLRSQVDITAGFQRHLTIIHCPECDRSLQPPRTWLKTPLESKELLTFCLKRLNNPNQIRLIHAEFIWTEPHSKRIKVKLKVQKEVLNGVVLEQAYIVEYILQNQMCDSCSRVQANPVQWVAVVQLRQQVAHRRTFFYLEQLILKHDAAMRAIRIKQTNRGIDFFFANRSHASNFVVFVEIFVPIRKRYGKQLVSHDTKSNNYNYKYTFSVEICPICREDLVCPPPNLALGRLLICTKISTGIEFLDLLTLRHRVLEAKEYWRTPFTSLLSSKQLVEFVVLDLNNLDKVNVSGSKYYMADVQVARVSDFGKNDTIFFVRTHLGQILKPGDYALGYDLRAANMNDMELDKYRGEIPEVILVKKSYEERRKKQRGKQRSWKLKTLNMEVDGDETMNDEYEEFCRDLEENPELRFNISLYRNEEYQPSNDDDPPSVPLEELLADVKLNDEDDEMMG